MNCAIHLVIFGVLLLAEETAAQRTWTVGGPNSNFQDLPPAVAAASPGDIIVFDGFGDFSAVSTSKGLTLVSNSTPWPKGLFVVHDLPAGQEFCFLGFASRSWGLIGSGNLLLKDNKGTVHIDVCSSSSGNTQIIPTSFVRIERCADVSINASFLYDLEIIGSRVSIVNTWIKSTDDTFVTARQKGTALIMTNSRVTLAGTYINGEAQSFTSSAPPGIRMTGGELVVAGTTRHAIVGGVGLLSSPANYGPPIESNGGRVVLDPGVALLDRLGRSSVNVGNSIFVNQKTPYVVARPIYAPGKLEPVIHHFPGSIGALILGLPTHAQPLGFGELWLDPQSMFSVGVGTLNGTGTDGKLPFSFGLQTSPFPLGLLISFQSVILHQGKIELSVPVRLSLR